MRMYFYIRDQASLSQHSAKKSSQFRLSARPQCHYLFRLCPKLSCFFTIFFFVLCLTYFGRKYHSISCYTGGGETPSFTFV